LRFFDSVIRETSESGSNDAHIKTKPAAISPNENMGCILEVITTSIPALNRNPPKVISAPPAKKPFSRDFQTVTP
jgi:hypothetical protein